MEMKMAGESKFLINDELVVKDPAHPNNELFIVERIGRNGEVYDTRWRKLNVEQFRYADPDEIEARHRLR